MHPQGLRSRECQWGVQLPLVLVLRVATLMVVITEPQCHHLALVGTITNMYTSSDLGCRGAIVRMFPSTVTPA